jgi:hypothetical protein
MRCRPLWVAMIRRTKIFRHISFKRSAAMIASERAEGIASASTAERFTTQLSIKSCQDVGGGRIGLADHRRVVWGPMLSMGQQKDLFRGVPFSMTTRCPGPYPIGETLLDSTPKRGPPVRIASVM